MKATPTILLLVPIVTGLAGCLGTTSVTYEVVPELVAARDIPAGTIIEKSNDMFGHGTLYYKGAKPPTGPRLGPFPADSFPGGWSGLIDGKKVARELKKGEVVKKGDIVEPDGSPFREPPVK